MELKTNSADVGVIIGRFQIDNLHEAHIDLIETVQSRHKRVIVLLGVKGISPVPVTKNNPLDFETRRLMLLTRFPGLIISYIKDVGNDIIWSENVDKKILGLLGPNQSVILYGGRDSFLGHYVGKFPTQELKTSVTISASSIRKELGLKVLNNSSFRHGVIWAVNNQFPICYPTVDAAIYNEDCSKLLLCRKPNEDKFQFVGGFAAPESPSYEADVAREIDEELGIEVGDIKYIGSSLIDDWRYRDEVDKIKTLFFSAKYIFGAPAPKDDIVEAKWFSIALIESNPHKIIVNYHIHLFNMYISRMNK